MKKKWKSWLLHLLSLSLGLVILLLLVSHAGFDRFWQVLRKTSLPGIGTAILIYASSWLFRTWRLDLFTRQTGHHIDRSSLFRLYISSYALNTLLPAKLGDAACMVYLKMKGIKIGRAAAIVLQTRILDVLALIFLSLPALSLALKKGGQSWILTSVLLALAAALLPLGIVALDRNKRGAGVVERGEKKFSNHLVKLVLGKIKDAYNAYHDIARDKKLFIGGLTLSVIAWSADALTCLVVTAALGASPPLPAVFLAVSLGNIGKSVPITPGAVGIYESILSGVLVLFGVPFDLALTAAILDHSLKKLFNLSLGLPATTSLGVSLKEIKGLTARKT